jgi:transposase
MEIKAQISKEKQQSIITLRHEGQSILNISRTLKVSSSAVAKKIKHYDETCTHKNRHRKRRPRVTSAAKDNFIRVNCTSDCSSNKCFTEFK